MAIGPFFIFVEEYEYKYDIQSELQYGQVVQEFILGAYDAEATAGYNQNLSDISILKDPRSKDASQRYAFSLYGDEAN